MQEVTASTRGNVRSFKVLYTFPLEIHSELSEEFYVDFRRILRFEKNIMTQSSLANHRVVSLTDEARSALQQQMSLFFGFDREKMSQVQSSS